MFVVLSSDFHYSSVAMNMDGFLKTAVHVLLCYQNQSQWETERVLNQVWIWIGFFWKTYLSQDSFSLAARFWSFFPSENQWSFKSSLVTSTGEGVFDSDFEIRRVPCSSCFFSYRACHSCNFTIQYVVLLNFFEMNVRPLKLYLKISMAMIESLWLILYESYTMTVLFMFVARCRWRFMLVTKMTKIVNNIL